MEEEKELEGEFLSKDEPDNKKDLDELKVLGKFISHLQQKEEAVTINGIKGVFR